MALFKCKSCGGDLEIVSGESVCTCEYCGVKQTVSSTSDENVRGLYNRANILRLKSEFDKAEEIYEKILNINEEEAEAHWGIILCKYGIEYVEDPATFKRIPTCHRASYDSVAADEDYKLALQYAAPGQYTVYEEEAKKIEEIQKGILQISLNEKPYDIFICYKETGNDGKRTVDSTIANDIYYQLTQEGYKVFYAAITLEDKLGQEYEPYIFSALNSAKIMLVIGTRPEYFTAVWVKNEWSRYLKIMQKDRSRLLIPCYRDMDAYELPEEFAHLQAQDMGKIGFINDIVRGIRKVISKEKEKAAGTQQVIVQQTASGTSAAAQVKRGNMALEDEDWEKADGFFEKALNLDPECAEAYLGKMLVEREQTKWVSFLDEQKSLNETANHRENLEACSADTEHIMAIASQYAVEGYLKEEVIRKLYETFDRSYSSALSCRKMQKKNQLSDLEDNRTFSRVKQYAKDELKKQIESGLKEITEILEKRIRDEQEEDRKNIASITEHYREFLDETDKKVIQMQSDALKKREEELKRQEAEYRAIVSDMKTAKNILDYNKLIRRFYDMNGFRDTIELAEQCRLEIRRIEEEERVRIEEEARRAKKKAAKKRRLIAALLVILAAAGAAAYPVATKIVIPDQKYQAAAALMDNGEYESAIAAFEELDGYKDSEDQIIVCETAIKDQKYESAMKLLNAGKYVGACELFAELDGYKDSDTQKEMIFNQYSDQYPTMEFAYARIGDTVFWGTYEQDNVTSDGKEAIE